MSNAEPYDIALIGDGCASWMLLEAFSRSAGFSDLRILLLGPGEILDRSWCFWANELPLPYKDMIEASWQKMSFISEHFHTEQALGARSYHYLPGKVFFQYFQNHFLQQSPQISYKKEKVTAIEGKPGAFTIRTPKASYQASQVYNSGWTKSDKQIGVWQHFRGWFIEMHEPAFSPDNAILMDFTVSQERGCSFMYVLPMSEKRALVELTFFSRHVLDLAAYEDTLHSYITENFGEQYQITHREFGKIPMQQGIFSHNGPNGEINIGTLAGMVKPSTGYAFQRMREDSETLVNSYFKGTKPIRKHEKSRFGFYDALLLWIILHKPEACKMVFTSLFQRNKIAVISRFMDEKTQIWEELKIFLSLPFGIFLKALWYRFLSSGKK